MPLLRSETERARPKDEVSPLLVLEWRSRDHSAWRCMDTELGDMHCSGWSKMVCVSAERSFDTYCMA